MKVKKIKVVLTGGGTAGHVYPVLDIWEEFKKRFPDQEVVSLYIGSKGGPEEEILKSRKIKFESIYAGKWRRYFDWKNFLDLFKVFAGFWQALYHLIRFRPAIVLAKGGYVTVPVGLAAWILRVPIFIHESDSTIGLSNRILYPFAKMVATAFPVGSYYPIKFREKMIWTGLPIRQNILSENQQDRVEMQLGMSLPTVLVMGGSQGAQFINELIFREKEKILGSAQVIHLVGNKNILKARSEKESLPPILRSRYHVFGYLNKKLGTALASADIVVARCGANTIFELAALGKPSILIPYYYSASGHQEKNADLLRRQKAAVILYQDKIDSKILLKNILSLINNPAKKEQLSKRISKLYKKDAAEIIASHMENIVKRLE
jgi:UDP-N-acetylglucosamine--N-acetylmuramyl-(pentapeptide) pyrophosphoryl-undecaprenol N-acetylglucosamine transferase